MYKASCAEDFGGGVLVPGECIRGVFGMIWGSGGCSLGKPYLGNPSRAGNWAGRVVWWGLFQAEGKVCTDP